MKIYSMTATFGKLDHETLTLKPGLNILTAPNEWGKSTWCAFLLAMLYGIDTRAKTTKTALADKERYAPWSGAPMEGSMDLHWQGRDITIQRRTKGRLIMGDFRAFETDTGMDVPELTAANCGQMLLGVERSVFERAGFLRLKDLPVTQDDALRRRLNNLVTTGDESGAGDTLARTLKDLKNKCRYNQSGKLPEAERERRELEDRLQELEQLENQSQTIAARQEALEQRIAQLENHKDALSFAAAQADTQRVAQAQQAQADAEKRVAELEGRCKALPSREAAEHAIKSGEALEQQWQSLQMERQLLPPLPEAPAVPDCYRALPPQEAPARAKEDFQALQALEAQKKKRNVLVTAVTAAAILACAALAVLWLLGVRQSGLYIGIGAAVAVAMTAMLLFCAVNIRRWREQVQVLYDRHSGIAPDRWIPHAQAYADSQAAYAQALQEGKRLHAGLEDRKAALEAAIAAYSGDSPLSEKQKWWDHVRAAQDALTNALRDLRQAQSHAQALQAMAKTAPPPRYRDELTCSETETEGFLQSARFELRQLQQKSGQNQGRREALGQASAIRADLKAVTARIQQLEDIYAALDLAQRALSAATTTLQRRFAPRISKRAQALFGKLTGGRYQRITLGADLSLQASAEGEDTLRPSGWRSDGTADQLYLALRLAVAEELTPEAPLVLDDALVRFDDKRLAAALDILAEMGQTKQVLLFTCQDREAKWEETK